MIAHADRTKTCRICDETKPLSAFYRKRRAAGGHDTKCRRCTIARSRKNAIANPASRRRATLRWNRKQNGWTDGLVAQAWRAQAGCCAICMTDLGTSDEAHADHDHVTGAPRGLLCAWCNFGLGRFRDNPDDLRRAIAYLDHHNPKGGTP